MEIFIIAWLFHEAAWKQGLLSPLPHVNLKTTKPLYVKSFSEERAETWFTSPHRARAAVNTRELQPLQVCQHILDTKERLHSSLLYPDPAALPSPDAADAHELLCSPGSCCRTGLCSQARSEGAPGAGLLPEESLGLPQGLLF